MSEIRQQRRERERRTAAFARFGTTEAAGAFMDGLPGLEAGVVAPPASAAPDVTDAYRRRIRERVMGAARGGSATLIGSGTMYHLRRALGDGLGPFLDGLLHETLRAGVPLYLECRPDAPSPPPLPPCCPGTAHVVEIFGLADEPARGVWCLAFLPRGWSMKRAERQGRKDGGVCILDAVTPRGELSVLAGSGWESER